MSQRRLAACLAAGIAIISVTLHGCAQEALKAAANKNITDTNESTATPTERDTTTPAATEAPTTAPTKAPAPPAEKDTTTPAATEAPTTDAVTTEMISQFETMEKGTCCCSTANKIGTKEDCLSALKELMSTVEDLKNATLGWEGEDSNIPGACSVKVWEDGSWHGHWNKVRSGKKRDDMIPICGKADDDRLRLFDDAIQGDGPSSKGVGFVACLSMGLLMAGVGFVVMRRGATWPVNRREVDGLILGDESEPEEA